MKNTKKKGFTIVELVIVLAVIGILSAILIPTFSNVIKKANEEKLQLSLANAYTDYATMVDVHDEDDLLSKDKVAFKDDDGNYYYYSATAGKYLKADDYVDAETTVATVTPAENALDSNTYNGYKAYTFTTTAA